LFKHKTQPTQFTLVVDNFSVKYVGKEHADHLVEILIQYYTSQKIGTAAYTVESH